MSHHFEELNLDDLTTAPDVANDALSAIVISRGRTPKPGDTFNVGRIKTSRIDDSRFDYSKTFTVSEVIPIPRLGPGRFNIKFCSLP